MFPTAVSLLSSFVRHNLTISAHSKQSPLLARLPDHLLHLYDAIFDRRWDGLCIGFARVALILPRPSHGGHRIL